MRFFQFGPAASPLFGTLHQSQRLRRPSSAVVLCNPFGEEAARSHRIYRVLATQLDQAGFPTLRFDFHGTGDSTGSADAVRLDRWLEDIGSAAAELSPLSARHHALAGLRLGGTLASLATTRRKPQVHHLLLWDPVVRGANYLRELADAHSQYMVEELGEAWHGNVPRTPEGFPTEALGAPLPAELTRALAVVDLTLEPPQAEHVTVVSTQSSPDMAQLRDALPRAHWIDLATSAPWNSDAALNSSIIPMDVVQALVDRLKALSP